MDFAFPSGLPARVEVSRAAAQRIGRSSYTLSGGVADLGGRLLRVVIEWQPMHVAVAGPVIGFIRNLDGMANRFYIDLDPYCPGWDPLPGTRYFRLSEPQGSHVVTLQTIFEARIEAIEDIAYPD